VAKIIQERPQWPIAQVAADTAAIKARLTRSLAGHQACSLIHAPELVYSIMINAASRLFPRNSAIGCSTPKLETSPRFHTHTQKYATLVDALNWRKSASPLNSWEPSNSVTFRCILDYSWACTSCCMRTYSMMPRIRSKSSICCGIVCPVQYSVSMPVTKKNIAVRPLITSAFLQKPKTRRDSASFARRAAL